MIGLYTNKTISGNWLAEMVLFGAVFIEQKLILNENGIVLVLMLNNFGLFWYLLTSCGVVP